MIVRDEVCIAAPVADVAVALRRYLVDGALNGAASNAVADGQAVAIRPGRGILATQVAVLVEPGKITGTRIVHPMRWTATGLTGQLFPALDANLELEAIDGGDTRLMLIGSYIPPLGRAGAALDNVLLHAIASATLRSFLARIQRLATAKDATGGVQVAKLFDTN